MKNSKLVKIVLIMIISLSVIIVAKNSLAATTRDLTNTLSGNYKNNIVNNSTNNTVLKTNNTNNYNNTSLPKTGVEDSIPAVLVVFGISAVYAYKKIQDYKNI